MCVLAIPFVHWSTHLDMYRDYALGDRAGGYISYKRLRAIRKVLKDQLLANPLFPGSIWAWPTLGEARQRIDEGRACFYEGDEEEFEWHAGLIQIASRYYWTDPIAYFRMWIWAQRHWRDMVIRADGVTRENFIDKVFCQGDIGDINGR